MALAFRAKDNADEASGSSITLNKPSGTLQGDILIAIVCAPTGTTLGLTGAANTAWGSAETITGSYGGVSMKAWIRQAGASEASSWAGFTLSPSAISSWAVLAFSGGKGSDIIDASQVLSDDFAITTGQAAASTGPLTITPSGTGRLAVYIVGYLPGHTGSLAHTWIGFVNTERVDEGETNECQLTIATGAPNQDDDAPYPYDFLWPYSDYGTLGYDAALTFAIFLNPGTAPTITSVTPDHGPTTGGESITVAGTGFNSTTTVTIDATACTGVVILSTTTVTAVTPAGTVGGKTLTVRTDEGTGTY